VSRPAARILPTPPVATSAFGWSASSRPDRPGRPAAGDQGLRPRPADGSDRSRARFRASRPARCRC
jgi:hypothetical protein